MHANDLLPISLVEYSPEFTIFVDSSKVGYGCFISDGSYSSGEWSIQESIFHINYLELKAVYLALQQFLGKIKG